MKNTKKWAPGSRVKVVAYIDGAEFGWTEHVVSTQSDAEEIARDALEISNNFMAKKLSAKSKLKASRRPRSK